MNPKPFYRLTDLHSETPGHEVYGEEKEIIGYLTTHFPEITSENWKQKIEQDNKLTFEDYPYYHEDSFETILIEKSDGNHNTRNLKVKGMGRHDSEAMQAIKSKVSKYGCKDCYFILEDGNGINQDCPNCGKKLQPCVFGPFKLKEIARIEGWE